MPRALTFLSGYLLLKGPLLTLDRAMAHDKDINYVIMLPSNISWIKGLLYFLDSVLLGQR